MATNRNENDPTRAGDTVEMVVRNAQGEVVRTMTGADIRSEAAKMEARDGLAGSTKDELLMIAEDASIPVPKDGTEAEIVEVLASRRAPLGIGEVLFEGTPYEIGGPGPEWEKDENGGYANRG